MLGVKKEALHVISDDPRNIKKTDDELLFVSIHYC